MQLRTFFSMGLPDDIDIVGQNMSSPSYKWLKHKYRSRIPIEISMDATLVRSRDQTLAMVKALLEPNPPTRLRTGIAAELIFRPMSMLSDTMRDSILWSLMQFDSVHVKISDEKK